MQRLMAEVRCWRRKPVECGTVVRDQDDQVVINDHKMHATCVESRPAATSRRAELDALNQLAKGNGRATVV